MVESNMEVSINMGGAGVTVKGDNLKECMKIAEQIAKKLKPIQPNTTTHEYR